MPAGDGPRRGGRMTDPEPPPPPLTQRLDVRPRAGVARPPEPLPRETETPVDATRPLAGLSQRLTASGVSDRTRSVGPPAWPAWAVGAVIATLPLVFVPSRVLLPIPGLGVLTSEALGTLVMLVAGVLVCLVPSTLRRVMRPTPATLLFLLANGAYLAYLAGYVVLAGGDATAGFFLKRAVILLAAYAVAVQADELLRQRRLGRTVLLSSLAMTILLAGFVSVGLRRAGSNPVSVATALASGNLKGYTRPMNQAYAAFATRGGDAEIMIEQIWKNAVGESLAVSAGLLVVCAVVYRPATLRLLAAACGLMAITTLSRSTILAMAFALLWLILSMGGRRRVGNLAAAVALLGIVSIGVLMLSPVDPLELVIDRFGGDRSSESRAGQYTAALSRVPTVQQAIFGSGPLNFYDGLRVHNLTLSSWIEGGLIGLAFVLTQYAAFVSRGVSVFVRRGMLPRVVVAAGALAILGVFRTNFAGGGGYYTPPGSLAVMLFLAMTDPAAGADRRTLN